MTIIFYLMLVVVAPGEKQIAVAGHFASRADCDRARGELALIKPRAPLISWRVECATRHELESLLAAP